MVNRWISTVLISLATLSMSQSHATETDNFSTRYSSEPLPNADEALDREVNRRLEIAANQAGACQSPGSLKNRRNLILTVKKNFSGGFLSGLVGNFENYAATEDVPHRDIGFEESIYNGSKPMGNIDRMQRIFRTYTVVNVADQHIGVDKFGHFFDQGFEYFQFTQLHRATLGADYDGEDYAIHPDNLEYAIKQGAHKEKTYYGTESTGVDSFADRWANYRGFLFWYQLIQGPNPYFKCENGKWRRSDREFRWKDHVDAGWDEAINCSNYSEPSKQISDPSQPLTIKEAVEKNLQRLSTQHKGRSFTCPVEPAACTQLMKNIDRLPGLTSTKGQALVIHPSCRNAKDSANAPLGRKTAPAQPSTTKSNSQSKKTNR